MQDTQDWLAAIERQIATQDAEWGDAHAQLLAAGEVQLLVDEAALEELALPMDGAETAAVPAGFTRA